MFGLLLGVMFGLLLGVMHGILQGVVDDIELQNKDIKKGPTVNSGPLVCCSEMAYQIFLSVLASLGFATETEMLLPSTSLPFNLFIA